MNALPFQAALFQIFNSISRCSCFPFYQFIHFYEVLPVVLLSQVPHMPFASWTYKSTSFYCNNEKLKNVLVKKIKIVLDIFHHHSCEKNVGKYVAWYALECLMQCNLSVKKPKGLQIIHTGNAII